MSTTRVSSSPDQIVVSDALKIYGGSGGSAEVTALSHVDLTVDRGQFVSIIGPSGCGKSTLLRLIAGLERADSGDVSVFGADPDQACAAKMIGFVPQVPALLPWLSVVGNVTLPSKVNRRADALRRTLPGHVHREPADPRSLLAKIGLGDSLDRLPHQLSGGMQQRVAIARAFAIQADVLLMDEPFSALDEFTREAIQVQLLELWEQMRTTVVFVTHSVSEAVVLSDKVVVMSARPGRIEAVVDIDLPRPRRQGLLESSAMHEYEDLIRGKLQTAWAAGPVTR
ncbi:sulfonate ABC transporter ATP-binding protein [Subtercola boreus]|uniref:Sulfonate ABC transporter ATP-binding protein n=1 Tax=Subtercola boreus TaxID=120213 RepID=A0A3E0VLM9_9MICO|nr:ABC transporter ATP-binding protein [Subtercola boreus]RFA10621.1 sulfonate ABC transporter ATP-binding protein [Subtercola boreus]TQL55824.1 NitT/TauT family transport system ATP-binding protein [Subtercola boreus]